MTAEMETEATDLVEMTMIGAMAVTDIEEMKDLGLLNSLYLRTSKDPYGFVKKIYFGQRFALPWNNQIITQINL